MFYVENIISLEKKIIQYSNFKKVFKITLLLILIILEKKLTFANTIILKRILYIFHAPQLLTY